MHRYFILKKKLNNLIPILLILIVGMITHWQWFFIDGIFSYGDTLWSTREKILSNLSSPKLMIGSGLGIINISLSNFPANFLAAFLLNTGISANLIFKLLFLFPIALLTPLSVYLLANYILKNKLASITASTIYSYSTPIIVGSTGIMTSAVVTAIAPLILLYYIKFINEKNIYHVYICLFYILISIAFDVRFVYLIYLILLLYTFYYYILKYIHQKNFKDIFKFEDIKNLLIFLIFSFLINLYWILVLFTESSSITEVMSRSLWGSNLVSLTQSIFINHSIWNASKLIPFHHNPLSITSLIIPFIFIAALLVFNKKNYLIIFFIITSFFGIFLTKMNHPPFANIYEWLYLNFPGFGFFRESSKFYFITIIGYAVVISSIFLSIKIPLIKYILFLIINITFLINTLPLITGKIDTMYVERKMPKDYSKLNKLIETQSNNFFRTLYIPRYSQWGQDNPLHPRLDFTSLLNSSSLSKNPLLIPGSNESLISNKIFFDFLNNISVKYIVLPIKDIKNNDNFYAYLGSKKYWETILDNFANARNLKRVNYNFNELVVYENSNYKGKFRMNDKNINKYQCTQFNNCKFKVELNNELSKLTYSMNFSNNYKIYIEKNGNDITKNYLINHFEDDNGLNNFNIIKKNKLNNSKPVSVLIHLQVKKEFLLLQNIFGIISLLSAFIIFYNISIKRVIRELSI